MGKKKVIFASVLATVFASSAGALVACGDGIEIPQNNDTGRTVTFDANGGVFGDKKQVKIKTDANGKIITAPTKPTYDDYTFLGYTIEKDGSPIISLGVNGYQFDRDGITVYAKWDKDVAADDDIIITFDVGEYGTMTGETTAKAEGGKLAELPEVNANDGYKWNGWYTAKKGGEEVTTDTVFDKSSTIFAQYTYLSEEDDEFTITLDVGEGTLPDGTETTLKTVNGKLESLPIPTPNDDSQKFNGWYTAKEDGEEVTTDTEFDKSGTIYAVYGNKDEEDDEFTITLNVGDGMLPAGDENKIKTVDGKLESLPTPTPNDESKKFVGWYTAEEDGEEVTTDTEFDKDDDIYARYVLKDGLYVNGKLVAELAKQTAQHDAEKQYGATGVELSAGDVVIIMIDGKQLTHVYGTLELYLADSFNPHGVALDQANGTFTIKPGDKREFYIYARYYPNADSDYAPCWSVDFSDGGSDVLVEGGCYLVGEGFTNASWNLSADNYIDPTNGLEVEFTTTAAKFKITSYDKDATTQGGRAWDHNTPDHYSMAEGSTGLDFSAIDDSYNGVVTKTGKYRITVTGTGAAARFVFTTVEEVDDEFTITLNVGDGTLPAGDENKIKTVDGKLESLPTPTPNDESKKFVGWYTAEEDGEEVTTDTEFDKDDVIYARYVLKDGLYVSGKLVAELEKVALPKYDADRQYNATDVMFSAGDVVVIVIDGKQLTHAADTLELWLAAEFNPHGVTLSQANGTFTIKPGEKRKFDIYARYYSNEATEGTPCWSIDFSDGLDDDNTKLVDGGAYLVGNGFTNADGFKVSADNYIDPVKGLEVEFEAGAAFKIATCDLSIQGYTKWDYNEPKYYSMATGKEGLNFSSIGGMTNGAVVTPGKYLITVTGTGATTKFVFTPVEEETEEYTITFDACDGTCDTPSAQTVKGKLVSLPTPTAPDGQYFVGWFTAATGGDEITTNTGFDEDKTIYAQYDDLPDEEFVITFNAGDGTCDTASAETVGGQLASLPTPTAPVGYKFDGWYTAATGGKEVTTAKVFDASGTIYAHYSLKDSLWVGTNYKGDLTYLAPGSTDTAETQYSATVTLAQDDVVSFKLFVDGLTGTTGGNPVPFVVQDNSKGVIVEGIYNAGTVYTELKAAVAGSFTFYLKHYASDGDRWVLYVGTTAAGAQAVTGTETIPDGMVAVDTSSASKYYLVGGTDSIDETQGYQVTLNGGESFHLEKGYKFRFINGTKTYVCFKMETWCNDATRAALSVDTTNQCYEVLKTGTFKFYVKDNNEAYIDFYEDAKEVKTQTVTLKIGTDVTCTLEIVMPDNFVDFTNMYAWGGVSSTGWPGTKIQGGVVTLSGDSSSSWQFILNNGGDTQKTEDADGIELEDGKTYTITVTSAKTATIAEKTSA